MPVVDVRIGNRQFEIGCDAGQESHVLHLAEAINRRFTLLEEQVPSGKESLLLAMTALMVQDELEDAEKKLTDVEAMAPEAQGNGGLSEEEMEARTNQAVTEAVEAIAQYVEGIAERIKNA